MHTGVSDVVERKKAMDLLAELAATGVRLRVHRTVMKAYRNHDFLNSSHARHLRILAEYEETMQRLRWSNVRATIQFFGSARACDAEQYDAKMSQAMAALAAAAPDSDAHTDAVDRIAKIKQTEWMVPYMASIQELARMITQ